MSKDVNSKEDVKVYGYVKTTNEIIGSVKTYNKKLFDQVKQSYQDLYVEKNTKPWRKYKLDVELDESTINKIVKIVNNPTIMKFYDQLPGSWGTLSVLTTMNETDLIEVIESGRIKPNSTKKEVKEVRDEYQGKKSNSGDTSKDKQTWEVNQLRIDLTKLEVTDEQRVRIQELFEELETFGFVVLNDKESQSDDS
jgi:DNA replicative helicase MCM subunit Mcm2 (Cdc46/Mcm family)